MSLLKSFYAVRIIEHAIQCRFDYPEFWRAIREALINKTEYEMCSDAVDILALIKD